MAAKAVVLVVPPEVADDVARLIASALSLNGYGHNSPSVIDWPVADVEGVCESCGADANVRLPDGSTWCKACDAAAHNLGYDKLETVED